MQETLVDQVHDLVLNWGDGPWEIQEVGNGNINYVFVCRGPTKTILVKKALPFARIDPVAFPLGIARSSFETKALQIFGSVCPEMVPRVHGAGEDWIAMDFLSPHQVLRHGMLHGHEYVQPGLRLGEFIAKTARESGTRKGEWEPLFQSNLEMRAIIENLDYTAPFCDDPGNNWLRPELDKEVYALWNDETLQKIVRDLKREFLESKEVLLHGDLHTGSIMAHRSDIKVIDPEFAIYGPLSFDLSRLLANFLMGYLAAPVHHLDRTRYLEEAKGVWNGFCNHYPNKKQFVDLFPNTLRHAGVEIIRRTVGIAGIAEFRTIEDRQARAQVEKQALRLARKLICNPFTHWEALQHAL